MVKRDASRSTFLSLAFERRVLLGQVMPSRLKRIGVDTRRFEPRTVQDFLEGEVSSQLWTAEMCARRAEHAFANRIASD